MKLRGVVKGVKQFEVKPGIVGKALAEVLREAVRPEDIPYGGFIGVDESWRSSGWGGQSIRPATAEEVADFKAFEQWQGLTKLLLDRVFTRQTKRGGE